MNKATPAAQATVAWTMIGYTLAIAAVSPWQVGPRSVWYQTLYMGSLAAFKLGWLLSAMAPNVVLLTAFRVPQGLTMLTVFATGQAGQHRCRTFHVTP